MIQLYKWQSYNQYVKAQQRGSRRRISRRPSANAQEFDRIHDYVVNKIQGVLKILCHGARCGTEIRLFRERFPIADVIGTDLTILEKAAGYPIVQWDFMKSKPEWIGKFDLVYSNSLDHASDPLSCLKTWTEQLTKDGLLFVTWCWNSMEVSGDHPLPGGDCFGAGLHEYLELIKQVATIKELLWVPVGRGQVVIVAGRKG